MELNAMDESRNIMHRATNQPTRGPRAAGGSLLAQAGALSGVTGLAAVPIVCTALVLEGTPGVWAALAAGAACLGGGLLGLVMAGVTVARRYDSGSGPDPRAVPSAVMLATLGRMCLPLAAAVAAGIWISPLRHSGMSYYLLGFYLVGLATATWLMLPADRAAPAGGRSR